MLLLNSLILALGLGVISMAQANECHGKNFQVMRFNQDGQYQALPTKLFNLNCHKRVFSNEFFKIVHSTSDESISLDVDEDLRLRVATIYYHLSQARNYWINNIGSQFIKEIPQIIIRVEMGKRPSRTRHFRAKNVEVNNAITIMPGKVPPQKGDKKWGHEIWFSPMEVVDVKKELEYLGSNPITQSMTFLEPPVMDMAKNNLIFESMDKILDPELYQGQSLSDIFTVNLGTMATIKGVSWASQYLDYIFVQDEYYMDTALVADVIYHEFAHVALSKYLAPKHSRPVIEGMADYFVAAQTSRTQLYLPQEGILNIRPKNAKNKDTYLPERESEPYARRDFVLSFLWKVRENLEKLNLSRKKRGLEPVVDTDQLIFEARTLLSESSLIYPDLTRALVQTCKKVCNGKRIGVNAIHKAIFEKGFN